MNTKLIVNCFYLAHIYGRYIAIFCG